MRTMPDLRARSIINTNDIVAVEGICRSWGLFRKAKADPCRGT